MDHYSFIGVGISFIVACLVTGSVGAFLHLLLGNVTFYHGDSEAMRALSLDGVFKVLPQVTIRPESPCSSWLFALHDSGYYGTVWQ